jgi:hypothetical protein
VEDFWRMLTDALPWGSKAITTQHRIHRHQNNFSRRIQGL